MAEFSLVRTGRKALPKIIVRKLSGEVIEPDRAGEDEFCYEVPPYTGFVISWRSSSRGKPPDRPRGNSG
jgi:hypothetical protein